MRKAWEGLEEEKVRGEIMKLYFGYNKLIIKRKN